MQSLSYREVPIGDLHPNPWNTNRCSPEIEQKIRASIERNGLFKPVIVRQVDGVLQIIGGQHRWQVARDLGHVTIPIVDLGPIDELRAKEIGVIDNARYGADDTLSFAELLKELGTAEELQDFLPYGSADLDAIFSASDIDLDELGLDENFDADPSEAPEEAPAEKPAKTHTILRFKVTLGDAERITELVAQTQRDHGYTAADDLTNAGDALSHLLIGAAE